MAEEGQSDRRAEARKQVRLLMARGEFAEARAERCMRSLAAEASSIRLDPGDQPSLDRHAFRARTVLDAERMLQASMPGDVVLGDHFERFATRSVIASDVMVALKTSTPSMVVGGELCRWVMTVAAELSHAVEAACDREVGCSADINISYDRERGLVMRVAAVGGADRPVPSASGIEAIDRTRRLMEVFGAYDQMIEGDDLVYEVVFSGCAVRDGG